MEAITFEELVQYGRDNGANIVNDMPWSFNYKGYPVTHENDSVYLVLTPSGTIRLNDDEVLITGNSGFVYTKKRNELDDKAILI